VSVAAYGTIETTSADATFQSRVKVALVQTAVAVTVEDPLTSGHAKRALYAYGILNYMTPDWVALWTLGVAADGLTDNTASDADLLARVGVLWSAFASVAS
jgi:hypothetical protein